MRTRTDAFGRFYVDSLVPGETLITTSCDGFGVATSVVNLPADEEATKDLLLLHAASVSGVVRDQNGAPIKGAVVRIGRQGSLYYRATVTDERGAYQLRDVPPGCSLLEVTDYGGGFACELHRAEPGAASVFDAVLSADDLKLSGRVVTAGGQPMAHAWVMHSHRNGQNLYQLDADGRYAIELSERDAAVPSSLHVFPMGPGGTRPGPDAEPVAVNHDLPAGTANLEIRVAAQPLTGWLRGSVRAASAALPSELRLCRAGEHALQMRSVKVRKDGTFEAGPLAAGCYELRIAGSRRLFGPFELNDAAVLEVGELPIAAEEIDSERSQYNYHVALVFPVG